MSQETDNKEEIRKEIFNKCEELALKASILDELETVIRERGFAGSADIPKLVYLVLHTGMLERPVSLVIKGPSGAGKSFSLNAGKQFIPETAYKQFEGMSEKALVYLPNLDLQHKHLIIGEAAGMAEGNGRTLLRQLVSEGEVRYATVQSTSDGIKGSELPALKGPTGLIMTTTATGLHQEDESRMLTVNITESPQQIADALIAQAEGSGKKEAPLETGQWFALHDFVRSGPTKVDIPFARDIAVQLPRTHDRIKRDFPQVLSLIIAHALMHSCSRDWLDDETVVANADDYAAVYNLINQPLSQGLAVSVSDSMRQIVEGVTSIQSESEAPYPPSVSQTKLAQHLNRDQSVISRNVKKAIEQGYLRNDNPGHGREAELEIGELSLPSGSVLPSLGELFSNKTEVAAD